MRRTAFLLALLVGCGDGPTAVADTQVSVRVARHGGLMTISNIGTHAVTFVAMDRELYNRVDLSPCESWVALGAGAATTVPITKGASEMVVSYCAFAVPVPARPTRTAMLSVPVR